MTQSGTLADNLVHFARALRHAGIRTGPAQLKTASEALQVAGLRSREDVYHTLRAVLITRAEDLALYHQVFQMFWRDPDFLGRMLHLTSPKLQDDTPPPPKSAAHRRASEALQDRPEGHEPPRTREEITRDARVSASGNEVLGPMDFEQMSAAELRAAEAAIRALKLPVPPLPARRFRPGTVGQRTDAQATLRRAMRTGGEVARLSRKGPEPRNPDLVAICDISGSMTVYSRMILLYLHSLAHARSREWGRVEAFTFGTQLTHVTRALRRGDPDLALSEIGQDAQDWQGGTRIGDALERFNKDWSRRVLGQGAVVILITDGLERGEPDSLARAAERLGLTARRLIWLNPLLRFDRFAPQAQGIRALLPHVHSFHACHSLDSLAALSAALGTPDLRNAMLTQL